LFYFMQKTFYIFVLYLHCYCIIFGKYLVLFFGAFLEGQTHGN
jgi:hypothetical protein